MANSPYSVAKAITRYKLYQMVEDVPGDFVECGVYQAEGLICLSNVVKLLAPLCIDRVIWGFDTFEGFANVSPQDQSEGERVIKDGMLDVADVGGFDAIVALVDANTKLAAGLPKTQLIKGDLAECLPSFLKDHPKVKPALLIADVDIYAPTLEILINLVPLMPIGGVVALDDYASRVYQGCGRAFDFYFENTVRLRKFVHDPWMTYFEITPEVSRFAQKRSLELNRETRQ
tara:strand:+ start:32795 stop:33487 length:693 start_codon:yes stop_codon:yes gene_type:complete